MGNNFTFSAAKDSSEDLEMTWPRGAWPSICLLLTPVSPTPNDEHLKTAHTCANVTNNSLSTMDGDAKAVNVATTYNKINEPKTMSGQKRPLDVKDDWKLISQGAEGRIWKIPEYRFHDKFFTAIAKERFSKSYRHPVLDERLTKQRCRAEARILEKCKQKGKVHVPIVFRVEPPTLFLEFINGKTVRDILEHELVKDSHVNKGKIEELASELGKLLAQVHSLGIVHGDLTTSNMMICDGEQVNLSSDPDTSKIILIDFGLAKTSESAEERAVDLYVLERALTSTHPTLPDAFWETSLSVYATFAPKAQATVSRLNQVRLRGRKRECFG